MSHDQLQSACFVWLWNTRPDLRGTFWGTFNDIKQVEKLIGALMKIKLSDTVRRAILSKMKGLGMVKGLVDFIFYYKGVLYVMDFKIGPDKLSPEQKDFIKAIETQGGRGMEIRDLEQFKNIIYEVVNNNS